MFEAFCSPPEVVANMPSELRCPALFHPNSPSKKVILTTAKLSPSLVLRSCATTSCIQEFLKLLLKRWIASMIGSTAQVKKITKKQRRPNIISRGMFDIQSRAGFVKQLCAVASSVKIVPASSSRDKFQSTTKVSVQRNLNRRSLGLNQTQVN